MWPSASRSERAAPGRPRAALAVLVVACTFGAARAEAPPALDGALARLFPPPAVVAKDTLFLDDAQARRAEAAAGASLPSKIVTRYVARATAGAGAAVAGFVYVDTHLVRTLPETLLIVLDAAGRITRVEALVFREPREYLPSDRWFAQFEGRGLDGELQVKRGIRTLTGATLSSRAATEAVRRCLAVHGTVEAAP